MIGIYFSGTGNTRYAVERFVSLVDSDAPCFSIEDRSVIDELPRHDTIVFGFPVYYSNLPKIAKDFITDNKDSIAGKKVFVIATKALHNAYGIGYARQIFTGCGAEFIGSLQPKMPENIRDLWVTMLYTGEKLDKNMVKKADKKIAQAAELFKNGTYTRSGLTPLNVIVGTVLSWLPFYPKTDKYITAPKVNADKCNGCAICADKCPTSNIKVVDGKAVPGDKCTVCYRCCNNCPQQTLTVLGKRVHGQYNFSK